MDLRYNNFAMKEKYESVGLNYELIVEKYPNLNEYEEIVNSYLSDPFFVELEKYIDEEDYALAKDAAKGLYILAQELYLYPLYIALCDIYEDIEEDMYKEVITHYKDMMVVYNRIKGAFNV